MADRKHETSIYRVVHHLHHGGLHRALGIPEDEKIPESRLEAAMHSKNDHLRHMADLAHTMEGWHK